MPGHGVKVTYQPFSLQERMAPLAMMKEEYDTIGEGLAGLGEQANEYYQYLDPETKAVVNQYNSSLDTIAGNLATQGLKSVSRTTLSQLKRAYNNQIKPINDAAKTLAGMYEQRRQLEGKLNASGQIMFSGKMPTVKDLLENPDASPQIVSSGALYTQGMNASKTASARRFYESEFGKEIINGYIRTVQEQGYSPQLVASFIQNMSTIPELAADINRIRQMYNTQGLNDPIAADRFIMQGILDGIGYDRKVEYKEDIIGKENRAFARQKALAQFNADLEVDTARKKAAITKAGESPSARFRTIVSPRAVNTTSQQFYNSKTDTIEVPDYLFDKNGKLKKSTEIMGPQAAMFGNLPAGADSKYKNLMKVLGEYYTKEQISNMSKGQISDILSGMVHNSLQDAEGNSALYWNLDPTDTKELLSRVGELYEVESKEDGKWRYSRNTKDVGSDQSGKGSELIYDPVSNELFIAFDGSKKMYRLDKSVIGDNSILKGLDYYHNVNQEFGGMNLMDYSRDIIAEYGKTLQELTDKYNKTGKLTPEEQQRYSEAYEIYNQAVASQESAYELYSDIGPTIQTYLKKRNE